MQWWKLAGISAALLLVGSGGYFIATHRPQESPSSSTPSTPAVIVDATRDVPPGFKEYRSTTYHFSVLYPDTLMVKTYKEKGTALTVTFQSPTDANQGFQIFIVPYGEKTVSQARFRQDIPSGVIQEQTPLLLNGKEATMFNSTNAVLGDTREVWFINHGFLYEVTTHKELDSWLASIMQTWMFL